MFDYHLDYRLSIVFELQYFCMVSHKFQGTYRKDEIERHINACGVKSEIRRIDK